MVSFPVRTDTEDSSTEKACSAVTPFPVAWNVPSTLPIRLLPLEDLLVPWMVPLQETEAASRMAAPSSHAALGLRILPEAPTPGAPGIRRHRFETQSSTGRTERKSASHRSRIGACGVGCGGGVGGGGNRCKNVSLYTKLRCHSGFSQNIEFTLLKTARFTFPKTQS